MKKQSVKNLAEVLIFLITLTFLTGQSYQALKYKNIGNGGGIGNFYRTKVPIDVIAYGSSHAHCTINNGILWEEYGIPSFTLSAAALPIDGIYFFMAESFRVGRPRIALVETCTFPRGVGGTDGIYQTALAARWSPLYVDYVLEESGLQEMDRGSTEELLFRMPVVHSRYRELNRWDFLNEEPYMRGYRGSNETTAVAPAVLTDERIPLPDTAIYYMDKMAALCEKNDVELVFFNAAYSATAEEMARENAVRDYAEEKGIPYIGFNHDAEKYGFDYATEMREFGHVNDAGAARITRALADYCVKNYGMADRRGEKGYEAWDEHLRYLYDRQDRFYLREQATLPDYLQAVASMKDRYTLVLSLHGNYRALGDEAYTAQLEGLGVDYEAYADGGTFIFENGEPVYFSNGAKQYRYYAPLDDRAELCVYRDGEEDVDHVVLSGTDYIGDRNGVTILLYDPSCGYLTDETMVDVYQGLDVFHPEE